LLLAAARERLSPGQGVLDLGDLPDELRKVGMSKEHRVDPQVQVGLLVDPGGFPLEVHLFEGNKAGTTTLIPVLSAFAQRHGVRDMVVVADAGMLSAANLNALQDAGFGFIVGSRITRAPYDLAGHFQRHGNYFTDGQVLESARQMGTGKAARVRRVACQWKFKRQPPLRSTASASPSTPTSPTPPATSSRGSKQVAKRLARVRTGGQAIVCAWASSPSRTSSALRAEVVQEGRGSASGVRYERRLLHRDRARR
jgi:hypothetical protein